MQTSAARTCVHSLGSLRYQTVRRLQCRFTVLATATQALVGDSPSYFRSYPRTNRLWPRVFRLPGSPFVRHVLLRMKLWLEATTFKMVQRLLRWQGHGMIRDEVRKSRRTAGRSFAASLLLLCIEHSPAAQAPQSPDQLRAGASHIVAGEVTGIETRCRFSEIDGGGLDDVIDFTIAVNHVEKGGGVRRGDKLVATGFRPKTRLGLLQWMSLQGHSPLPARGEQVRAHLVADRGKYHVIHPNGFEAMESGRLLESHNPAEAGSWTPLFTFLLPLELWILLAACALPAAVLSAITRKPRLRKALRLVLAALAALWTLGLIAGMIGYVSATEYRSSWLLPAAVIVTGTLLAAACVSLTVWLWATARRPGNRLRSVDR
jgi:hypothetical protein